MRVRCTSTLPIVFLLSLMLFAPVVGDAAEPAPVSITYPWNGALFPADITAPTIRWQDTARDGWTVRIDLPGGADSIMARSSMPEWRPSPAQWETIKKASMAKDAFITVTGTKGSDEVVSRGTVSIRTSTDPVVAPIFYRDVILPVSAVQANPESTRWRLGRVSSEEAPQIVLEKVKVCVNCHSFTPDGKTLGMDVDLPDEKTNKADKGGYIIAPIEREILFTRDRVMSWNEFMPRAAGRSFGLFSQLSPDGRYVVSTVKDMMVFITFDDNLAFSQLFFPKTGLLAIYDRQMKAISLLPGASDPAYVQSNAVWSPDGKWIVFARAKAVPRKFDSQQFVDRTAEVRFDLYRVPFNGGKGGAAEPIEGACNNGRSNYFPKFTPDGKWIVFTQSDVFMLIQPDAELRIVPARGGTARKMTANREGIMSSWHSISPNGNWMVFASKANGPYTQLWLTHLDNAGNDSVPVLLERFILPERAANIPEFLNIEPNLQPRINDKL